MIMIVLFKYQQELLWLIFQLFLQLKQFQYLHYQ
ncbi:hypothetical protein pb186bvf_019750 [Paramecium bursaria]